MINPWDAPPIEPMGSPARSDLFASVGQAIEAWEQLESELGRLFSVLCETQSVAAKDAYGAVIAHNTRNDMLTAAAKTYFKDRDKTKEAVVLDIIKRAGKLAARRNEIAHGYSVSVMANGVDKGHYWIPPDYNLKKRAELVWTGPGSSMVMGKFQYTHTQIDAFAMAFWQVTNEVSAAMRTWPTP